MEIKHFGDSYDIVKKCFLSWVGDPKEWEILPMFTNRVNVFKYRDFMGGTIISESILTNNTNRGRYFNKATLGANHIFIDPDKGIRIDERKNREKYKYIYCSEIVAIANRKPNNIILIFDQSVNRNNVVKDIKNKLKALKKKGIAGKAYISHANFIILSCNKEILDKAMSNIFSNSRLPKKRFI